MDTSEEVKKSERALNEERILEFWAEHKIFEKTLQKESPKGEYVFYEGPPTANAKPALHHLEARAFKDVIPRYKTMQGFYVPRRAGWDTHGLPVELQIEKKLGLKSKKEIEEYGIAAFNKECKDSVFTYIKDWEKFTDRVGYWVDKENAYYTFNTSYIESLWNIVGEVNKKGLLYKDYKVVPWCPRCGTVLSSHELAQGYQDVKDLSVYAKFKVVGQENTYLLAWTTTPWTLPGNVALAVGATITYVTVEQNSERYILAKDRMGLLEGEYAVIAEQQGAELVGLVYEPLYPYFSELIVGNEEKMGNAYKVYTADFVTTTDGTGIVHTAVMYGADDFELGSRVGLPKFHIVQVDGTFIKGTGEFEGRFVKDEQVAIDIIKDLAHRGLLFRKEKYEHSYPHCWRCKTPLIYYARDSWYIAMSQLREQLVAENNTINWEPSHIQQGRFGEWLREIKDWAISRERYWGTPLPLWIAEDNEKIVVDSIDTMKSLAVSSGNTYFIMRHGQTENNLRGLWSSDGEALDLLTREGREQVLATAETLKDKNIDVVICSPFLRTQETATLVAEQLGIPAESIVTDSRIAEWNVGAEYNKKPLNDYFTVRNSNEHRYHFKTEDGESYADVINRSGEFLYDIEKKYAGKRILIVSHGAPTRAMSLVAQGFSFKTLFEQTRTFQNFLNAEVREVPFVPLPHNEQYELDLHRPYIDEVVLVKEGKEFRRTKEVMDVWFDSGSMPFAQDHYPFENKNLAYPADFISEAIDQTRGWFYTLHAVGTLMGKGRAYKNVICLGHLLDAQGKKMSKSIGNIVEPFEQMNKFGVDAVRLWMYSVNQPGDSKNYDEKTVDEIVKKFFLITENVYKFYSLYEEEGDSAVDAYDSTHVLDVWILTLLDRLVAETTEAFEKYDIFTAARALRAFVTELSTWYVRRSRDRFKDDGVNGVEDARFARATTRQVLLTFAKLIAPMTPFFAEELYQKVKTKGDTSNTKESVHLELWPACILGGTVDSSSVVLSDMEHARSIVTLGLEARQKTGLKVRQPLQQLKVKNLNLTSEHIALIVDELNVKEVVEDQTLETAVLLDTVITEALKNEGIVRELMRAIQDTRKQKGLQPEDRIVLAVGTNEIGKLIVESMKEEVMKTVGATAIEFTDSREGAVLIETIPFSIEIVQEVNS